MVTLFSIILLFSLLGLCMGLASPKLVSKGWSRILSRKQIALMFGSLFAFSFIAIALISPDKQNANQVSPTVVETPTATSSQPVVVLNNEPSPTVVVPTSTEQLFTVSNVVDGDTIDLTKEGKTERVRIIGLDTPETLDPRKPVQCFGKEASAKMKETLLGKQVILEADPSQGTRDKYQRLLGYVFLPDGTDVGLSLIQAGYAHEYTYNTPYKYQSAYKAAESAARVAQRGLWAPDTCNGDTSGESATAPSHAADNPAVKKSTTGICHEHGSSFYEKTKDFIPYDSLQDCLKSGGRPAKI